MTFKIKQFSRLRGTVLAFVQIVALSLGLSMAAQANTIVRVSTTYGDFSIELFDTVAPATVQNFLNYVNRGAFNGNYFHRLERDFVLQGGGYSFRPFVGPIDVPADPPVVNEFNISNTRGTVAMAKFEGNPNSATSQWFINLADNSANLNVQNGGFTVFGRVLGEGMTVVDAINQLGVFNLGTLHPQVPLRDYTAFTMVRAANFVTMSAEVVSRFSTAVSVFESQTGLLMTSVDGGEGLGVFSLNLSLQADTAAISFRLNADSLVPLASKPAGAATFSTTDGRLRIPQLELNFSGEIIIANNVVFVADAESGLLVLESFDL